jgi:fatty acid/phospholipid biosynthesis enzyme
LSGRSETFAMPRHEAAAVLLGVAGDVVVCHGSAGGAEVADGIALAARLHRDRITPAVAALADDLLTELSSAGGLTIRDALGERS